jgi:hypothetical protein
MVAARGAGLRQATADLVTESPTCLIFGESLFGVGCVIRQNGALNSDVDQACCDEFGFADHGISLFLVYIIWEAHPSEDSMIRSVEVWKVHSSRVLTLHEMFRSSNSVNQSHCRRLLAAHLWDVQENASMVAARE